MEQKPSYEELEKENKDLKNKLNFIHYHIGGFIKSLNVNILKLIIGAESPYKTDRPFFEIDLNHKNSKKYITHHSVKS